MRKLLLAFVASGLLLAPFNRARAEDDAKPVIETNDESKVIIEKAIKAYGGEEKLDKLKAIRTKGKGSLNILGMNIDFTAESVVQQPGQMKNEVQIEIQGQKLSVLQIVNADKAWTQVMNKTLPIEGDALTEMKEGIYAHKVGSLVPLRDKEFTLAPLGEIDVNGAKAVGVKVSSKGHKDIDLYFDKKSGLVVKRRRGLDPTTMMEVLQETFVSDFKEIDGLKYPSKVVIQQDGKEYLKAEVTEFTPIDKVDDSEFAKP